MTDKQPEALRLADYLTGRADELQPWIDDGEFVEFGYRPEGLKHEQAGFQHIAAELRRLHEENSALRREVAALSANALDDYKMLQSLMSERKPWVGLTDEDYEELLKDDWGGSLIQAVEAKLKEKNT